MTPTADGRPRVVLGVGGGIAAYKVVSLLRLLTESGHDVHVVPTRRRWSSSARRPGPRCPGTRCSTEVWPDAHEVPHVRLGREADLVVVAPATADLLARAAHGLADDLLTSTLLTATCPVLLAPAMHTEMWEHPATRANVATLRERGVQVIEPASGRLTGADTGPGRLPEPEELYAACRAALGPRRPAAGPGRPHRRGQRRRHPRAARPGALPGQPVVRQAGAGARPHSGRPRGQGHPGGREHRRRRDRQRRRRRRRTGRHRPGAARRRARRRRERRRRRHGRRGRRLPARRPTPSTRSRRPTIRAPPQAPTIELVRNPDVLAELVAAARRRPGRRRPGAGRLRGRDRRRAATTC